MWQQCNPNPIIKKYKKGKNKGKDILKSDCVIRAMSLIWNVDWMTTSKRLAERSFELAEAQTARPVYESFLKPSGIPVFIKDAFGRRRYMTVEEFAKSTEHKYGKYLLSTPHHLVCVHHGKYFDTWDSGDQTVRKIWIIKECFFNKSMV